MTLTVDAIWAVDADAETAVDSPAEIIPAAISFGSSFFFACAVTMDLVEVIAADAMTTAGLLSCCFCYVETMAVDVAADNHFLLAGGSFPLPLYILQDYNFVLIIHAA